MQREEPSARLVDPLCDIVGREHLGKVLLVLKGVVRLRIGHRPRVEPNVYKVRLAVHRAAGGTDKHNLVNIWPMQIKQRVVFNAVVTLKEVLQRVALHISRIDAACDLNFELSERTDAYLLLAVVGHPDGKRRTPVTGA